MKYILAVALAFVAVALCATTVSGHVLLTDETNTRGAILHIVPDDDPIAGKKATLFLDTQQGLLDNVREITLTIAKEGDGRLDIVQTKQDGALVIAEYVFPSQGVYTVRYAIASSSETYIFEQVSRVSRGGSGSEVLTVQYTWAEALLLGSGVFLAGLGIVAWNRRKRIAKFSTF